MDDVTLRQVCRGKGACLRGVDFSLNDVENGDVAALLRAGGHHDVLRLRQASHHVQHRCSSHGASLKKNT